MNAQRTTRSYINLYKAQSCWKTKLTDNALSKVTKSTSTISTQRMTIYGKHPTFIYKNWKSDVWYTYSYLGKTPLSSIVSEICQKVGTSKHYTNHCIRVSTTNIITKSGKFSDKEVMDFTGYKSVQSLQTYCCVSKETKMEMSKELSKLINKTQD